MANILVCDDDKEIVDAIEIYLSQDGYRIFKAYDGEQAIELMKKEDIQLLIMDIMMPKLDGIRATLKIREYSSIPIIILSAKSEDTDKILGLNIGADDYITKPFKLAVFLSRINALLRRSGNFSQSDSTLSSNGITIHLLKGQCFKNEELLELTPGEYRLLTLFMENPDTVLSSEQILAKLWDCNENFVDNKTLTVYIRRLRLKIEDNPGEPEKIVTVRGMGYKWNQGQKGGMK